MLTLSTAPATQHQQKMISLLILFFFFSLDVVVVHVVFVEAQPPSPSQLNGQHFKITVLQENGFLDIHDYNRGHVLDFDSNNDDDDESHQQNTHNHSQYHSNLKGVSYSGYLIEMIEAVAKPERANFTYTLLPPSGTGSKCVPRLVLTPEGNDNSTTSSQLLPLLHSKEYRTQYKCGESDVNDLTEYGTNASTLTDFYLGMYYISPSRQLLNQFTIPFNPPYSGTLQLFGTATHIPNISTLVERQHMSPEEQLSIIGTEGVPVTPSTTCGPAGTALLDSILQMYPGLSVRGIYGGEDDIYQHFYNGSCVVYINDGPIAKQFIFRRSTRDECYDSRSNPLGIIGDPLPFGLSHYSIGIRQDIPTEVTNTVSYWMNILMTCNPLDEDGGCTDGNLASMYDGKGGTGFECNYVLYPTSPNATLTSGAIAGIVIISCVVVLIAAFTWHCLRIRKQHKQYLKRNKAAYEKAEREREFNEFMVRNTGKDSSKTSSTLLLSLR
jgi:hypothetical protein